jgi:hypothetical protein
MSTFMTRCVVLREHAVTPDTVDVDGALRDDVVAQWVEAARDAYLSECSVLGALRRERGLALDARVAGVPAASALGRPAAVVVSASATEVHPTSFTIALRLRPVGGGAERAWNITTVVSLRDGDDRAHPLGDAVRDELIALEHAARHFN